MSNFRACIVGFYGWGNSGDEGILLSIIDSLGRDNEYIICSNLPYTLSEEYRRKLPFEVEEVRHIYDARVDYDVLLLGGGGLSWGFGWRQALSAFSADKASMNYGVGYSTASLYHRKLKYLYREFLHHFDAITVRDEYSLRVLKEVGIDATLTMCPSINLEAEKVACPENMVLVCPRYEDGIDYKDNKAQIDWLVSRVKAFRGDEVLLVPFAPYNKEGGFVDLALCQDISKRVPGARILRVDGYSPRKIKYLISRSKLVISGGRYHALVWASAHNVPFETSPTAVRNYPKITAFIEMHQKYGNRLKDMEKKNREIFLKTLKREG